MAGLAHRIRAIKLKGYEMKFDISIERIDNGYIFSGEGVTEGKHYYRSLEAFGNSIMEDLRELDRNIKECGTPNKPYHFKLETDLK